MTWLNLKLAARGIRNNPGLAATVIFTLALAIGANTAVFSLISFTLLEPLPFPDADRIMQFWFTTPNGDNLGFSQSTCRCLRIRALRECRRL